MTNPIPIALIEGIKGCHEFGKNRIINGIKNADMAERITKNKQYFGNDSKIWSEVFNANATPNQAVPAGTWKLQSFNSWIFKIHGYALIIKIYVKTEKKMPKRLPIPCAMNCCFGDIFNNNPVFKSQIIPTACDDALDGTFADNKLVW